ncbi:hypothetical protein BU26DRAFT_549111 [Trematosphaeria pertusa]|uniref:Uncharacterized protein n=1 Tax=Trematosphaeria pertusa TaxID=390896 RepID=A0A6A6IPS5_9PLEO|nr:uncharacterized protein BU26DRAFT_549111 [Trematosphaeria pertusa]KAF2252545.1 hypothetical protein BU26DRAFT_549111 [Trematosphaeria pertusa]
MNANALMICKAMENGKTVEPDSWLNDPAKACIPASCRFIQLTAQDVVTCYNEEEGKHGAVLVCSYDGASKILRKEVAACPLAATRAIVDGLHRDTGLLFAKFDVGDQLYGQQGFRGDSGKFELAEYKSAVKDSGPVDDTQTLHRRYQDAPKGPRGDFNNKRPRSEQAGWLDY